MKKVLFAVKVENSTLESVEVFENLTIEALQSRDYMNYSMNSKLEGCNYASEVLSKCAIYKPDILVISERLQGVTDFAQLIRDIKRDYPDLRIVALFVHEKPVGDATLATLVTHGVYDWVKAPWKPNEIAEVILHPKKLKDVDIYMPKIVEKEGGLAFDTVIVEKGSLSTNKLEDLEPMKSLKDIENDVNKSVRVGEMETLNNETVLSNSKTKAYSSVLVSTDFGFGNTKVETKKVDHLPEISVKIENEKPVVHKEEKQVNIADFQTIHELDTEYPQNSKHSSEMSYSAKMEVLKKLDKDKEVQYVIDAEDEYVEELVKNKKTEKPLETKEWVYPNGSNNTPLKSQSISPSTPAPQEKSKETHGTQKINNIVHGTIEVDNKDQVSETGRIYPEKPSIVVSVAEGVEIVEEPKVNKIGLGDLLRDAEEVSKGTAEVKSEKEVVVKEKKETQQKVKPAAKVQNKPVVEKNEITLFKLEDFKYDKSFRKVLFLHVMPMDSIVSVNFADIVKKSGVDLTFIDINKNSQLENFYSDNFIKGTEIPVVRSTYKSFIEDSKEIENYVVNAVVGNGVENIIHLFDKVIVVGMADEYQLRLFSERYSDLFNDKQYDIVLDKFINGGPSVAAILKILGDKVKTVCFVKVAPQLFKKNQEKEIGVLYLNTVQLATRKGECLSNNEEYVHALRFLLSAVSYNVKEVK